MRVRHLPVRARRLGRARPREQSSGSATHPRYAPCCPRTRSRCGAERGSPVGMACQGTNLLSRGRIPDARGRVGRCGHDAVAIGTERSAIHSPRMTFESGDLFFPWLIRAASTCRDRALADCLQGADDRNALLVCRPSNADLLNGDLCPIVASATLRAVADEMNVHHSTISRLRSPPRRSPPTRATWANRCPCPIAKTAVIITPASCQQ